MKQIKYGATTLTIPAMALGIMRMGDKTPDQAAQAIETAYEAGINFIDSADVYGRGQAETVFGQALRQSRLNRQDLFIESKVGIVVDPARSHGTTNFITRYDFTKQHILKAVDGILQRMGTDYLDAVLLHRPDPLMDLGQVQAAFDQLQASGKVRFFGVSNFNPAQFQMLQQHLTQRLMVNQLQLSLMHTGMIDFGIHTNMADEASVDHDGQLMEFCRQHRVTVQAWSPFQYGSFEGTFIDNPTFSKLNAALKHLADKYGVGKNAIAAAWILKHPVNVQMIMGTMNPAHIKDSAKGADVELTNQEWYDLYVAAGHSLP